MINELYILCMATIYIDGTRTVYTTHYNDYRTNRELSSEPRAWRLSGFDTVCAANAFSARPLRFLRSRVK